MGITGLTSFVKNNIYLKKVTSIDFNGVVVDGKSLIYHIIGRYHLTCTFGGQYPELAGHLEELFRVLRSNGIDVVVVFDGMDYKDQKRGTKLKRKKGSYSDIRKALKVNKVLDLLPLLAVLVFCQVLQKLQIPFIFVDGDADQKIARIANFYHYPVLANDSDYYIFDLYAGYMPLQTFQCMGSTVSAELYKRDSLVKCAGFRSPDLVLGIPFLIGNDFYEADIRISVRPNLPCGLGRGSAEKSIRLAVDFLSQFRSLATFISELDKPDPAGVQSLSDGVGLMKCMYDATPSFIADPIAEMETSALMPQNDGQPVPKELLLFFRRGLASMTTLEALCKEYVDLPVCFENLDQPSCYSIGEPLRATLYALLHLDRDKLDIREEIRCHPYNDDFKFASVRVARSSVLPMVPHSCKTFKEICSLPVDTRKDIILHCLQVSQSTIATIERLPLSYQLLAMITRYWYNKAVPKPKFHELTALILCLLPHRNSDVKHTVHKFNPRTTHICVQWQVVFKHIHDLNNLLSEPLPPLPPVSELLNCQLLHFRVRDIPLEIEHVLRVYKVNEDLFCQLLSVATGEVYIAPKQRQMGASQQSVSESPSKVYVPPHRRAAKTASSVPLWRTQSGHHPTAQHSQAKKHNPRASAPPTHSKQVTAVSSMARQPRHKQFHTPSSSLVFTKQFSLLTTNDGDTSSDESD